ncbi:hypothetical protein BGZ81_007632 [Podila clonocystis]|nr:hypothetical protein BGZ81_007632 [Podila clonocystis]
MFCPRLDSALVASIFNDIGDFKKAIPILSALAADSVPMSQPLSSTPLRPISAPATNIAVATLSNYNKHNNSNNKTTKTANNVSSPNKAIHSSGSSTTNQQNILMWSTEVANSNAGAGAAGPRTIGAYPTASNTIASTSAPLKQAFRALRNPKYMQKYNVTPKPIPPELNDDDNDTDNNELAQDDDTHDDAPPPQAVETKQTSNNTFRKKGPRKKSHKNTENLSSTTPTTPRRSWKKDQDGKHSAVQQHFDSEFTSLTLSNDVVIPTDASDHENEQEQQQQPQAQQQQQQNAKRESPLSSPTALNGPKAEEIEFLKSCFPDQEHSDEYLAQVLKDSQHDLEVAVDLILSRMFLENEQIETSSSGSGSLYSANSQATAATTESNNTTSSLDDAFFQGMDKGGKKKSKHSTAWGPVYNPAVNIFGDSHNDPLMNVITNQDEFLIPESNEWATFEHQVSILMNIFSNVPRKVIVSEYHSNGTNLFRTQGRHRQSEFDVQLAQLMEMFPNHTPVGLKKVLIYNGNNFHDAMNAVLAADFAQTEALATQPKKYAHMIPLQADVRFLDKTTALPSTGGMSSRLRSLPSTHNPFPSGTRMFPNTILDASNADLYNDEDDPFWCRQRAHETLDQRNELFRKAARAYKDARNKGVGMGGIAAFYADEGKKLDAQGKQWHMRAARAVVQQHRLENNDPNLVDLHGLTIAEAQTVVKEAVTQWFSRATMRANRIAAKPLKIICGVGSHSKDRIARLYPTILNLLMKDGWRVEADQGVILVKGVSRIMPSTSKK